MIRPQAIINSAFVAMGEPGAPTGWTSVTTYSACLPITLLPIADTELLNISHYAPIGVVLPDYPGAHPIVSLLLHPECTRQALFNREGRWLAPYSPIGLRVLPFSVGTKGEVLVSPALASGKSGARQRIETSPGVQGLEFKQVLDLLRRLSTGAQRLSDAARLLIAADVLVPVEPLENWPAMRILTVSDRRLIALDRRRAAGLTAMGMLPMELASAIFFSRRHLKRKVVREVTAVTQPEPDGMAPAPRAQIDPVLTDSLSQHFGLDTSSLFSLDDFLPSEETR